jgi:hypothetical protein
MPIRGGKRIGAGRKTIAKELHTSDLARKVLIEKYGSLEQALESLLEYKEPQLLKFVFEHAFGKTPEKIEHSCNLSGKLTLNIVRGKYNSK